EGRGHIAGDGADLGSMGDEQLHRRSSPRRCGSQDHDTSSASHQGRRRQLHRTLRFYVIHIIWLRYDRKSDPDNAVLAWPGVVWPRSASGRVATLDALVEAYVVAAD